MGFIDLLSKLFGNKSQRDLKEITPWVERVKAVYPEIDALSDDDLRARTASLRQRINDYVASERAEVEELKASVEGKELDEREAIWAKVDKLEKEILDKLEIVLDEVHPEAFAIVKSTGRRFAENAEIRVKATDFDRDLSVSHDFVRIEDDMAIYQNHWLAGGNEITWDMVHYDVQLFGGTVLHKGKIAEMATGEGKTLVATLPVFLNALTGNGVHVVTVNDYLSKRDSEWMGPLYMFHGLSVDCIDKHRPNTPERRAAYNADITFGTNNEFGFDYLRDNMATSPEDLVQRRHNYAIVDEVDSVLIDDARTPLIISGPVPKGDDQLFEQFLPNVETVVDAQRKLCQQLLIDAKKKISSSDKKEQEEGFFLLFRTYKGMPKSKPLIKYLSEPGIKAGMLKVEEEYMADNMRQMHLVTDELYFVIDEKHNSIELSDKGIDLLTRGTDDPTFFILPDIASLLADLSNQGLTPEELAERKEALLSDYAIKSERVHTVNQLLKAYALFEKDDQYVVMDNKVMIVDEQTGRIMDGRRYSDGLHQAIEAKEHVKLTEETRAMASITYQNLFRLFRKISGMTGTGKVVESEFMETYSMSVIKIPTNQPVIRQDLPDQLYQTLPEKVFASLDEVKHYHAQGNPLLIFTGSVEMSEIYSSLLLREGIAHNLLNANNAAREAQIIAESGQKGAVTVATSMAGRGTDIKLGPGVADLGGLVVIGTERMENQRIDLQIRGRSGRQGDPGISKFFISLEDDLLRKWGPDWLKKFYKDYSTEEVQEHPVQLGQRRFRRLVAKAQRASESSAKMSRRMTLEYAQCMKIQREITYAERNRLIQAEERIDEEISRVLSQVIHQAAYEQSYETRADLYRFILDHFSYHAERIPYDFDIYSPEKIAELLQDIAEQELQAKKAYLKSDKLFTHFQRVSVLKAIDENWVEQVDYLQQLKTALSGQHFSMKNPLVEYYQEAYDGFEYMKERMKHQIVKNLLMSELALNPKGEVVMYFP